MYQQMIQEVKSLDGRFLSQDGTHGIWIEVAQLEVLR
jgi:hypothetical protein